MLKVIGAVTLFLACGLFGLSAAAGYLRRPVELRAIRSALAMLETEIVYGATALPEAFQRVAGRSGRAAAPLFQMAAGEFKAAKGITAREAWDKALSTYYPNTSLTVQDLSVLTDLGSSLGISDREDQTRHLRLAIEQIGSSTATAEAAAARNARLWSYMGFLGGLCMVLILI